MKVKEVLNKIIIFHYKQNYLIYSILFFITLLTIQNKFGDCLITNHVNLTYLIIIIGIFTLFNILFYLLLLFELKNNISDLTEKKETFYGGKISIINKPLYMLLFVGVNNIILFILFSCKYNPSINISLKFNLFFFAYLFLITNIMLLVFKLKTFIFLSMLNILIFISLFGIYLNTIFSGISFDGDLSLIKFLLYLFIFMIGLVGIIILYRIDSKNIKTNEYETIFNYFIVSFFISLFMYILYCRPDWIIKILSVLKCIANHKI